MAREPDIREAALTLIHEIMVSANGSLPYNRSLAESSLLDVSLPSPSLASHE